MSSIIRDLFKEKVYSYELNEILTKINTPEEKEIVIATLKNLELEGKVYYDELDNHYKTFPSNFFVAEVKEINPKKKIMKIHVNNQSYNLPLPPNYANDQTHLIVSQNSKGKYHFIRFIDNLKDKEVSYQEEILQLFYPLNKGLSFGEIQSLISSSPEDIKKELDNLCKENIIYYDSSQKRYYPITKEHIAAQVLSAQKGLYIQLKGQAYYLPTNWKVEEQDTILLKKVGNSYELITILIKSPKLNTFDIKENIKNLFSNPSKNYSLAEIKKVCGNTKDENILQVLKDLELDGILYYDLETNRYQPFTSDLIITKVKHSHKGSLYVQINNDIYFLSPEMTKQVLAFDTIILKKADKNTELIKVVDRAINEIVCEVTDNGIKAIGNNIDVKMDKDVLEELALPIGTRFLAKVPTESYSKSCDVSFIKVIGTKDDLNADLIAIAYNNGFEPNYSEEELEELEAIPKKVTAEDKIGRVDLTSENIFTIDGENTKDMDDAVGIKVLEDGNYELTVAIAHVAKYIKFNSALWKRAEKNTTSLYLILSVLHMLHSLISNGICSLNPNVDRLTKTFRLTINPVGDIIDLEIFNAVINSKKKMTYEDVNLLLDDDKIIEGYEPFINDLLKMQELSLILSEKRRRNGAIEINNKEIKYQLDDEQNVTEIGTTKRGPAEKMIENFMLAVNEAVADYVLNLGITFIYRNHEIPIDSKVLETVKIIKNCGYKIEKIQNIDDPHVLQQLINSLNTKEEFLIFSGLLIKSMQKAYYSTENKGHYALALKGYSQTTSPIRRFLDLLIQYILDNLDNIEMLNSREFKEYTAKMCERASLMEKCADKAEYEANKLYMVDYCHNHPDEEYIAYIEAITPQYVVVKTKELIEGIVYHEDINDGWFAYNHDYKSLENTKTKEKLNIGSKLKVTLKDCNRDHRIIYFNATTLEQVITRKKTKS